jgi:hypothetical protein
MASHDPCAAASQDRPHWIHARAAGPNEKELNAFRSGLYAHGYLEGRNIVIEQRYAAGAYDRLGELAAQLVRRRKYTCPLST